MRIAVVLWLLGLVPAASAATPGSSGAVEQAPTLSPKEKTEFVRTALEEMGAAVKEVEKMLEQAKKENQQEVVECLKKKLVPMIQLLDVSRQSSNDMQLALSANDSVHAELEFRKVAVGLSKVREFFQEAKTCGGSTAGEKAKSVATISQSSDNVADAGSLDEGINPIEEPAVPGSPN